MTLKEINARIQKVDPLVELVRGEGYHYYCFDNAPGEGTAPMQFVAGDHLIYETESVMVPYLKQQTSARWIEDGIEFGKRVREEHGL